ncbi:MAG: sigma-70 family RNA polymerase sigma factor [Myxococcota bacterium]|jgi:RNA polymerase sigma-70 factor (ECF subfamily)|nr:sigma-70 family RNA polymerase sigma factor [Myxococcota bacterium]
MELVQRVTTILDSDPQAELVRELSLVRRAGAGDHSAQRDLVDTILNGVRTTVYCLAGNDRDADDFVQVSILEILGSAHTYRAESSLDAWAAKISVRTVMRQLKRRRWRAQFVVLEDTLEERCTDHASSISGEDLLGKRRLQSALLQALAGLKPKYQVALTLRLAQGYSVSEIAEITDTTFNTVRERLRVGRKKLHRLIVQHPQLCEWIDTQQERGI